MSRMIQSRAALPAAVLAAFLAACGDSVAPPGPPASMQPGAGAGQQAVVGTTLPVPPGVRVTDAGGRPSAGVVVTFTTGQGAIEGPVDTTDAQGRASVDSWTLGTTAGEQVLNASTSAGLSTTVTVTALPDAPSSLVRVAGDGQSGQVGQALAVAPSIRVLDRFGNPVPGATVRFTTGAGDGTVAVAEAVTDADGIATSGTWTLGTQAGTQRVTATLPSGPSVSFTATAEAAGPAALQKVSGDSLTSPAGAAVPVPPSVRVVDAFGNPVPGVSVTFAVTSGGGSITGANAITGEEDGVATVERWELGDQLGEQTLTASSPGLASVTFTAFAIASAFSIEVRFGGSPSARTQQAVAQGAARWQEVIVGDLPDVTVNVTANACGIEHPAVNESVDDVLIFAVIDTIDGPGKILGGAGWCVRRSGGLPALGVMIFDSADVPAMEANGTIDDVMLHEMGHVLGIGSLWDVGEFQLVGGNCNADPYFTGPNAIQEFQVAGGSHPNGVPIHNTGDASSICVHWRESVFGNELMSASISGPGNPLSAITVGSLEDLGYLVDYNVADPFSLSAAQWHAVTAPAEPWELIIRPARELPPAR